MILKTVNQPGDFEWLRTKAFLQNNWWNCVVPACALLFLFSLSSGDIETISVYLIGASNGGVIGSQIRIADALISPSELLAQIDKLDSGRCVRCQQDSCLTTSGAKVPFVCLGPKKLNVFAGFSSKLIELIIFLRIEKLGKRKILVESEWIRVFW